jgi:glutathione S-transferase
MTRTLYELAGKDGRRFSPYCWRARLALAHKGLDADIVPVAFTEKETIAFSGQKLVPVLVEDDQTVSDSWRIACHLEERYPDRPALFPGETGRGMARFTSGWLDTAVFPPLFRLLVADIIDHIEPKDRDYFRKTREKRLGRPIEATLEERDSHLEDFRAALTPARALLAEQDFVSGQGPAYADYALFSAFQWARGVSPIAIIEPDDAIYPWRARMLDLFDGLARSVPAYDY